MARLMRSAPVPAPALNLAIDCELHLEPALNEVAERALAEGWSEADVDAALLSLARHRITARIREQTGLQIANAKRQ